MPLNAEIAAILAQRPALPSIRTMDLQKFRAMVNGGTAAMPRYNVPLASVVDRTIAAEGVDLPVRIYTPNGNGPFPLIVFYHGGGYVIGDLNIADSICRAISSGATCVVMSVDYRLAPEHRYPVPNDDCWAALRWAAANAASIGGDATRLAVCGDSAGANLSASMTLRAREAGAPKLIAQALLYPSTGYPDGTTESSKTYGNGPLLTADDSIFYWDSYLRSAADKDNPDAAPSRAASHKGLPPAFVGTGECDASRDLGERYAALLKAADVPVVARRYAGMPHGFYNWVAAVPAVRAAMDELCGWLNEQFKAAR